MESEEALYDLIDAYLSGEMKGEERAKFSARIASDAELAKEVQLYGEVNDTIRNEEVFAFEDQWKSIRAEYQAGKQEKDVIDFRQGSEQGQNEQDKQSTESGPSGNRTWIKWVGIAAGIALIAALAIWFSQQGGLTPTQVEWATSETTEQRVLPDGSQIELGPHSTLIYPETFASDERLLKLTGEGTFEVTPDKKRPFRVGAGGTLTQVLGTVFTIRARSKEDTTWVRVAEGRVSFKPENASDGSGIILAAGDEGSFARGGTQVFTAPDASIGATTTDTLNFTFDGAPLSEVIEVLEAHYTVTIDLDDEKSSSCPVSGKLEGDSLEDDLDALEVVTGLNVRKKSAGRFLLTGKCR